MGQFTANEKLSLTSEGVWLSDGEEITHERTLGLFSRCLRRDGNGYYLGLHFERIPVTVEDAPYFVRSLNILLDGGVELFLNDGSREMLNPVTLEYSPGRLICRVKQGEYTAKFLRAPYYELLARAQESDGCFLLKIRDTALRIADR